eukprot:gene29509-5858_t
MDKSIVDYLALYDSCQLRLELKVKHVLEPSAHSKKTSQRLVEQKDGVSVHVVEDVGHIVQRNGRHVNSLGVQSDSQGVQSDSKGVQNDSQGVKSDSQQGRRPTSDDKQVTQKLCK